MDKENFWGNLILKVVWFSGFLIFLVLSSVYSEQSSVSVPTCLVSDLELQETFNPISFSSRGKTPDVNAVSRDDLARLTVFEKGRLWPQGEVYFTLDQRLTNQQIFLVYEAFSEFHAKTCIRFKPWKNETSSKNYVTITSTGDNGPCSLSEVCMRGQGQQMVQLGGLCWFKEMVIHQLGHTLCLGHEHQRPIRDNYLRYQDNCPENEIPTKLTNSEGQLGFYDYASQMHFACGWCSGGWPKKDKASGCGYQVTSGLSLLDADYLNLLYGCGGCHRHRWVPVDKLIPEHKQHLYSFGHKDRQGYPLYPCRVSYGGEIIIGKFTWQQQICSFSLEGREHYQTGQGIEILLIPGGLQTTGDGGHSEYKVEHVTAYPEEQLLKIAVPAGRLSEAEGYGPGYVAYGRAQSPKDRMPEDTVGKAWEREGRLPQAFFPLGGRELGLYHFKVLTCHNYQSSLKNNTIHNTTRIQIINL